MIETSDKTEPVLPSATVVLVRDGQAGLEALLVQRNTAVRHMGGMWVFPGGKVDVDDIPRGGGDYQAAVNAAIRETREEAGLTLNADQLLWLSHWTTPQGAKKRFATWFFLAILADDQEVQVDGGEISSHRWLAPDRACAEAVSADDALRLMPPTFVSLCDIAQYRSCEALRRGINSREAVIYAPRMVAVPDGICFLYAGDAGYESKDVDVKGARHRFYMIGERLEYIRPTWQ
jgi:8-oxo-dGTP pyrophosphatase MutT (NUDIX family)